MSERPRVLVVEDGHEYVTNLERFLGDAFEFVRSGDGFDALEELSEGSPWAAVFLDMRFDRADRLLGDIDELIDRFAGDRDRARRFLEDNQGAYILAAIREAGHRHAALFSYDFDSEPRRFRNLERRYGPIAYLADTAGPAEIRRGLEAVCQRQQD